VKSLQLAQMSTASMGKFDKKVNKYEPAAPSTLKGKPKKKSNQGLHDIQFKKGHAGTEKERNLNIFNHMMKEKEYKASGKVGGAAQDDKKMVKNHKLKSEKFKKYVNATQQGG
jgi:hypothetical protein